MARSKAKSTPASAAQRLGTEAAGQAGAPAAGLSLDAGASPRSPRGAAKPRKRTALDTLPMDALLQRPAPADEREPRAGARGQASLLAGGAQVAADEALLGGGAQVAADEALLGGGAQVAADEALASGPGAAGGQGTAAVPLGRRRSSSAAERARQEPGELFRSRVHASDAGLGARELSDLADDVKFRFSRTLVMISRRWRTRLDERLRAVGVTGARWQTLFWIAISSGGVTQRELADRVGIRGPTLVRILHGLEEQGLIERGAVAGDRRANAVRLTPKAQPLLRQIDAITDELRDELLQDIHPSEMQHCLSVFERILERMDSA